MKQSYFLRRLVLLLWLAGFALGAAAQAPGGGNTGGPPGGSTGGGSTPGGPGNGGSTGGPPSPGVNNPSITSFTPASGPVGTVVTLTGTNLGSTATVAFNGVNASTFTVNSATQLTVTVPAGATTGPISVATASGTASSASSFTVTSSVTAYGNVVTLNGGADYINLPANPALQISGAMTVESLVKISTLQSGERIIFINCIEPDAWGMHLSLSDNRPQASVLVGGAPRYAVAATSLVVGQWAHLAAVRDGGTLSLYVNGVLATSLSIPTGPLRNGSGLSRIGKAQSNTTPLAGQVDEVRVWNVARTAAQIQADFAHELSGTETGLVAYYDMNRTGQGAGLTVANRATATGTALNGVTVGTATTPVFTPVNASLAPSISSFTPGSGASGTSVAVTGTGFTGLSQVTFNGVLASFGSVTGTSAAATVPSGATTGPITVTNPYGSASSTSNFVVDTEPVVSSFTPTSGAAGTSVTISGSSLGGATSVSFGGTVVSGPFAGNTASSLTVTAPAGATSGPICVTTALGTGCSSGSFTFPPTIATGAVSPLTYCAGTSISVPFTTNMAAYAAGNQFRLQLSDASGAFGAAAPLFGALLSSGPTGGTVAGIIPATTPGGTGYRVRVVASDPATTGAANAADLTINPAPVSQAGGPASVPYGGSIALTLTPTISGATYSWSGPLGFASTQQNPVVASNTNVGPNRYTCVVTLNGCTYSSFVEVTVLAPTAPLLTLTTFNGPLCPATPFTLSFGVSGMSFAAGNTITAQLSDAAGSFASPTAIGSAAFSGQGNGTLQATLPAATAGTSGYRIRLVGSSPASTSNDNGADLTVSTPPTVTLAAFGTVCVNAPAFALSGGLPAGGTYRVNGTPASSFNPASAGPGSYTVTYSYTAASGCSSSATQTLTVQPLPTVTLAAPAPACLDQAAYALTGGAPTGGTYSGPGVSGGQFNPATAGVGTHTIRYTYTDGSGCANSATQTLTVLPLPTLTASSLLVCAGQPVTLTVSNAGSGASYSWSTGASTSSITVNPTAQTTYSVTVTNAAGCAYPLSRTIDIRPSTATPGAVSQMQPVDNAGGLSLPIAFSWAPGADTETYDLYVWPENGTQPATPTVGGLTSLAYNYGGPIPYGQGYRWRVVSRTPCGTTAGPVQTFRLRQLPDVYVSHIVVPDTAYANQQIEIEWNVGNAGLGSTLAQQWTDEVYVSQDSIFSGAAVLIGRRGNTTFLQPNATYITTASFPVQLSQAGRYYVFVRADGYNNLLESNENNNRRRAASRVLVIVPETPDFSLENFVSPPDNSIGYTDVQLRYRVFNRGTVPVTQPRTDEFFISPDTIQNIAQNTGRLALGPNAISLGRQRVTDTLLPGGFYQRIVTVRIPHTQFGTRYFYAYTDTDNQIFEVASTNNTNRPVPVNVVLRPPVDLAPFRLTAPAATVAGQPLTVTWDVRNDGLNAPVPEERFWADQFWLSPTATFDPQTAISVGTANVFGGDTLLPGHHYRRSVTLNIPNGLSGQYYVFGKADYAGAGTPNGNVFEYTYEANNQIRSAVVNVGLAYADLEPTAFTAPATIDAYQTFTINYTVRNNSSAVVAAAGTWYDEVHIATPGGSIYSYGCSLLGRVPHTGPLAPGQSYSGTMTLTIPRWVRPGEYDLVFGTDEGGANSGGRVYEYTFEGNNTARQRFTYRYSDDLRATALSSTGPAHSGQNLQVNWQVDNQGAFRTLATQWSDQVFLSVDNVLDNADLHLASPGRQGELAVGAGYSASATVRIPHGLQGNYFLIVKTGVEAGGSNCTTTSSVLSDTDPTNNVRTAALPITLTPPCDLVVQSVTFPTDVVAGQQVQIPFTIKNQGVGATLEGEWNDGIYLNTSPTVNGATRIGNFRRNGVLAAGQSYSVLQNVTIPAYMSGNYYIFLVTDNPSANGYSGGPNWGGFVQYGQVYEHQAELNNTEQSNLLIRVPAPADLVVTSVTVPGVRKLGETMTVHYQVKNQGANPAVGLLKDGLFLSQDLVLDGAVDRIFGTSTRNIVIQPNQTVSGVVKSHVQAVNPGAYNGLMATNLYDDIFEGPANNNNVLAAGNQLQVTADDLPLRTTQPFALDLDSMVFYRVTPGAGKDMVLQLGSNQQFGQNEVYVGYNRVPTAADYDYIYESQVSPTQELLIPSTGPAPYYVLVKTPYVYNGAQTATLRADTLGFQVRSITANRVGQGRVTTRILGANFNRNTRFYLTRGADTTRLAVATLIRFRSSVDVTVRWFLDSLAIGQYNVVAQNGPRRVQLPNGLTVEPKRALSVDFATITPRVVRVGANANWTYFLKNTSNVDVPYWEFQYNVPGGSDPVVTHTPNVRKKSDFTASPASATTRNRLLDGTTDVLPFVARDLVPDEVIQVNLRLTPSAVGLYPVVWNQAALNEEWYTRQTLDHIQRYRQAVLANPAQFPASVASLAANQATWQDSLQRYYQRQGLLDAAWLGRPARTGYTASYDSVRLPGGICGNWNVKECVTPFRPDPFGAPEYPVSLIGCADSIVFTYKGRGATCTEVVGAVDPNLIVGPDGLGKRKMVGVQQTLNYQVQFENDPLLATAPAQVVRITVPLSQAFEPRAFRLGDFGWGTYRFSVPAGSASHMRMIDMPDSLGYDVRVVGTVDVVNRRLLWQLETIDPATGLAPIDPNKGFLLINDSTGRGQGFVDFTIKGSASAFTGDTLAARASIVFDTNEPILTNRWWNILDAVAPTSHVAALPPSSAQPEVALTWTAGDDPTGSGLRRYAVYASQDRGPFVRVADNLAARSYTFSGQPGSRYDFFTLATDSTDNQEALKTVGEAFTVIEETLDVFDLVHNQCLVSDTIVSTGAGQWQYLRRSGKVVAALNDGGRALGKVAVQFTIQEGLPTRADSRGTEYLDRNWKLYAQNTFAGNSVKVRFYGLTDEFDRLKAANDGDGNDVQTIADLRLTQYSGPNEDCLLGNNDFGPASQVRLLTPTTAAGPANAPTPYFVAEVTVFDHFSEFYLNGGTAPLPVTLTRFGAVRQGADVRLSWQTAQERNSAYFAVEASAEPQQGFREVARVAARGNSSSVSSYEALDRQVPATGGLRYYRLRQVDTDGSTTYSPVVAVALDKAPLAVRALPNPFRQAELQLTLELPEAATTELLLSDLAGRSLLRRTLHAPAGTTTVALPELARLSRGVYMLTVKAGTTVRQLKLLKD